MKKDPTSYLCLLVIFLLAIGIVLLVLMYFRRDQETQIVYIEAPSVPDFNNSTVVDNSTTPIIDETPTNTTEPEQQPEEPTPEETPTNTTDPTSPEEPEIPAEPKVVIPTSSDGQFKGEIEFGVEELEYGYEWPSTQELAGFDIGDDWRLSQIKYKRNRDQFSLSYLQFVFNSGYEAPPCMAKRARETDELVVVDIDHRRKVTGVQVRMFEKDGKIEGMRLIDDEGQYVFDETWYGFGEPEPWGEVVALPEETKIIGYRCETEGYEINKLALQVW